MASPPSASKMHASPSKGASSSAALTSANRTYDAKLVQREMLRLGTLAGQLPAAALSTITGSTAAVLTSGATTLGLGLPTPGVGTSGAAGAAHGHGHALGHGLGGSSGIGMGLVGGDGSEWAQLHIHVLPLFNHEQLQYPIEDLNALVKRHIEVVVQRGPARALATLDVDVAELIGAGMTTLNTKLAGIENDKLVGRVVELWTFFWDKVLPYVEGVFIPLQTDTHLQQLHRAPKSHRPSSPTTLASPEDEPQGAATHSPIDVRTIALRAFRDKIIVPVATRLEARLVVVRPGASFSSGTGPGSSNAAEAASYQRPRLQQMLLVLHSQAQRARPALSLTAPTPSLLPQELTIRRLLDVLAADRLPLASSLTGSNTASSSKSNAALSPPRHRRAPSFLSGGAPRDRRGRIGIGLNGSTDKENAKRRARYIDDSGYAAPAPAITASSSYTEGANGQRPRPYLNRDDWPEDDEWEGIGVGGITERDDSLSWEGEGGGVTPRGRFSAERERDRSFLESLRSPNPGDAEHTHQHGMPSPNFGQNGNGDTSVGTSVNTIGRRNDSLPPLPAVPKSGLDTYSGLSNGVNGHRNGRAPPGMSDVEGLDWDSAQAVVERMVGMSGAGSDFDHSNTQMHPHTPSPAPAPPGAGVEPPAADSRRRRMT